MDRRDALHRIGLLTGVGLSAPILAAALGGCKAPVASYTPANLSPNLYQALGTIADIIIPETDTPGAKEAGVDQFIDSALSTYLEDKDKDLFIGGLNQINEDSLSTYETPFADLDLEKQTQIVQAMDQKAYEDLQAGVQPRPFFTGLKQMVLTGYYMSEIGATQELRWIAAPGRYDGAAEMGKTWA